MTGLLLTLLIAATGGEPSADHSSSAEPAANHSSTPTTNESENLNRAMVNLGEAIKKGEKNKEEKPRRSSKTKAVNELNKDATAKKLTEDKNQEGTKKVSAEEAKPEKKSLVSPDINLEPVVDSATQIANEAAQLALEEIAKLNAIGSNEINMPVAEGKKMAEEVVKIAKEALPLKEEKPAVNQPTSEPARP